MTSRCFAAPGNGTGRSALRQADRGATGPQPLPQMMKGLETGRLQVASRALGSAVRRWGDALAYAQERKSLGKRIRQHQSIGNYLAGMAISLTAARQLTLHAAREADEAAVWTWRRAWPSSSPPFDIEQYVRDAPLMIVGEAEAAGLQGNRPVIHRRSPSDA